MNITQETRDLLKASMQKTNTTAGFTTSTGLVAYSLEAQAKLLYPVLTPLRNAIPRSGPITGFTGTAEHWKILTSINSTNVLAGVPEGQRNILPTNIESDQIASYKTLSMEGSVSWQGDWAGLGFDDLKALAVLISLQNTMLQEENYILNGNTGFAIGAGNKPTTTSNATGTNGAFPDGTTNYAYVVPLTAFGFTAAGGAQNPVASAGTLTPIKTITGADSGTITYGNGVGQISSASNVFTTTGGSVSTVTITTAPTKGAFGYAWFVGTSSGTSNSYLVAITSLPTVTITGIATSTYAANGTNLSTDNSVNALAFDGLISVALNNTGYYKSLAGNTLTADGFGGVVEIDTALKSFWDNYKIAPTDIYADSQTIRDITKKVLAGNTNPAFRVNVENGAGGLGNLTGANLVTTYLNKYAIDGAQGINLKLHPNMPTGTIFFDMKEFPTGWSHARVSVPRRMRTRREYFATPWPVTTMSYTYATTVDEMLQVYAPFSNGVITDIAAG